MNAFLMNFIDPGLEIDNAIRHMWNVTWLQNGQVNVVMIVFKSLEKQIMSDKMQGSRPRGRPRLRWTDNVTTH